MFVVRLGPRDARSCQEARGTRFGQRANRGASPIRTQTEDMLWTFSSNATNEVTENKDLCSSIWRRVH